ncbi:oxidoreductase, partial [cyanobacterium TDX16]
GVLGDAVLVNVSTGTPAEAEASAQHADRLGVRYVTGAVMVPTPMVGTDECVVLYAGDPRDLELASPVMAALGGTSDVVGEDHAVPPALDLAMLDVYFAGMYAFLHSAALADAHGIDPTRYLPYAEGIVATLGGTLPDLTDAITRRTYDGGEARLDMCLAFLEHIVRTSEQTGIDPGLAAVVRDASLSAMDRWPGSTDWDVVAEDLLTSASSTPPSPR